MFVRELHIDGFGIFHDCSLSDLPEGLVVFSGDNESGKTTLMQFFRMVLFGPPDKRSKRTRNQYAPLRGGQHGGRIEFERQDGSRVSVERNGKKVTVTDGSGSRAIEPRDALLGGIDRGVFERVYAIGLNDLQGLDLFQEETIRSRILSAGSGMAVSLPEVFKGLDDELDSLLTRRGRIQKIPELQKQLSEIGRSIRECHAQAPEFAELTAQRDQAQTAVEQLQEEQKVLRQRQRQLEQLQQARDPWIQLTQAREQIGEFEYAREFPIDGIRRFEAFTQEIDELSSRIKQAELELTNLEEQRDGITVDTAVLEAAEAIESLSTERQKLSSVLDSLPDLRSQMEAARRELERHLRELGPDWTEQQLDDADTSLQARERVDEFRRTLDEIQQRFRDAQTEERNAASRRDQAEAALKTARSELEQAPCPPITDPGRLAQRRKAIRSARDLWRRIDSLTVQIQAEQTRRDDAARRVERLAQRRSGGAGALPAWLVPVIVLLGVAGAGVFALRSDWLAAGLSLAAGIGLAVALLVVSRQARDAARQQQLEAEAERADLEEVIRQAGEAVGTLDAKRRETADRIAELREQLDLSENEKQASPDRILAALDQAEQDCELWIEQVAERTRRQQRVRERAEEQDRANDAARAAAEQFEQVRQAARREQTRWKEWLEERGFDRELRPAMFNTTLGVIDAARTARSDVTRHLSQIDGYQTYVAEIRQRLGKLCASGGESLPDGSLIAALDSLTRQLADARTAWHRQEEIQRECRSAQKEIERLMQERTEKQSRQSKLLTEAGASDEEEFRRRAEAHETCGDLDGQIREYETALATTAGSADDVEPLVEELSRHSRLDLEAEHGKVSERLESIDTEITGYTRGIGELDEKLSGLAGETALSELLFKQQRVKQQLADVIRRWAVRAVCRSLLEQTRERYERERQPGVIRKAEQFLDVMVPERYRMIHSVGEESIQLEDSRRTRRHEQAWSSGLGDQVYLAIRLALAREFGEHSEPLPLILDDVLVRFDPTRRQGAARALLEFSRQQQVLLFTCDPAVRDAVLDAARERASTTDAETNNKTVACFELSSGSITRRP